MQGLEERDYRPNPPMWRGFPPGAVLRPQLAGSWKLWRYTSAPTVQCRSRASQDVRVERRGTRRPALAAVRGTGLPRPQFRDEACEPQATRTPRLIGSGK